MSEKTDWKDDIQDNLVIEFGGLIVNEKTILLLAGQSLAGKTITCLHFLNEAILQNKKVAYLDIDEKTIIDRQQPNLFKEFSDNNQEKYDHYFVYYQTFAPKFFFEEMRRIKPILIIIDGLYHSFCSIYPDDSPKERAKKIKDFLMELRKFIKEQKIGVIITTPTGRVTNKEGKTELIMLGGEGIKYLSDVKVMIQFVESEDNDNKNSYKRIFFVDRQSQFGFNIEYGGHLISIE